MKKVVFLIPLTAAWCVDTSAEILVEGLPTSPTDDFKLRIVHWNDVHSRVESGLRSGENSTTLVHGYSALAAAAHKDVAAGAEFGEIPLIIDGGDTFTGTVWSTYYKGQENAELLGRGTSDSARSGVMVTVLGNHEFDYGPHAAEKYIEAHGGVFVSCNMDWSEEPSWEGMDDHVHRFYIKEVEIDAHSPPTTLRIGFIGTTPPSTKNSANPGFITFEDELTAIPKCIADAKTAGAEIIILVSHSGDEVDKAIAKADFADEIFGIIGGHSHKLHANTEYWPEESDYSYPENFATAPKVTYRVESYHKGTFFGSGVWEGKKGELKPTSVTGDSKLVKAIDHCSIPIEEKRDEMAIELDVYRKTKVADIAKELVTSSEPMGELNFGNLVCDAFVWYHPQAILGFKGTSGIVNNIPVGEANNESVSDALPYSNFLFVGTCPGKVLKEVFAVSGTRLGTSDFLQVGGEEVFIWFNKDRTLKEASINGTLMEDMLEVSIVLDSYVARGGYGGIYDLDGCILTPDLPETDVVSEYMKHLGTVDYELDGRILVGEPPEIEETTTTETTVTVTTSEVEETTPGEETSESSTSTPEESNTFDVTSCVVLAVFLGL